MRNRRHTVFLISLIMAMMPASVRGQEPLTSVREIEIAAMEASVSSSVPVTTAEGRPVGIAADFDGSGTLDYAMMTVRREPGAPTDLATLSDRVRLYRHDTVAVEFRLEVFYQHRGALGRTSDVIFGRRMGMHEIELVELNSDGGQPYGARVTFLDPQATETHLVVFLPDGTVSPMVLTTSPSEDASFLDITRDGLLDLLITRRLPEAGRGFETYLDFHVLSDAGFSLAAGTNIVRNLQTFLATTQQLMEERHWDELIRHAGGPYTDGSIHEQLLLLFRPAASGSNALPFVFAAEPLEIHEVVFPQIVDNPFSPPYLGRTIDVTFRVSCCDWEDHLYRATIGLSNNPFYGRQYRFLTRPEVGG